jgi:hypothetical protein
MLFVVLTGPISQGVFLFAMMITTVMAFFTYFIYPSVEKRYYQKRVRKLLQEGKRESESYTVTLSIDVGGIESKSAAGEGKIPWKAIEKIEVTDEYAYLFNGATSAVLVPRRAFSGDEQWNLFITTAQQYQRDAHTGDTP